MRRKWKQSVIIAGVFVMLLCGGTMSGCSQVKTEVDAHTLKTTILRVGKADAIVLETGGKAMVIDAGEEEDGEEVVEYLEHQHISQVEALVITHYDQDHVGGADTLVECMDVKRVLVPAYEGNNVEFMDFENALEEENISPESLTQSTTFSFGDARVCVEPPSVYEVEHGQEEMDNNFSLITTVTHGENRLLFMGDAEKWRIRDWLSNGNVSRCQFFKVPHHGVYQKALKEVLEAVDAKYAVICSSKKNPADPKTLELLKKRNLSVFQTKDGNVTVLSDGKRLEIDQELEKE